MNETQVCSLPSAKRRMSLKEGLAALAALDARTWGKAIVIAIGVALVIGLPTRLIPNPIFIRMIPTTSSDYVFYAISAVLMGLTWAIPVSSSKQPSHKRFFAGGVGTVLAVGCPTCNKLVLLLLGSGGALNYFAPLQPVIGVLALILLVTALWKRLESSDLRRANANPPIP